MKKLISIAVMLVIATSLFAGNYKSFKISVYTRAYEVEKMADPQWLEDTWNTISSQVKIDKIYLETHRDRLIVPQETLDAATDLVSNKKVECEGNGLSLTLQPYTYRVFSF